MVFHYHSGSTSGFHCHPESFRVFHPLPVSSLSHQQHSVSAQGLKPFRNLPSLPVTTCIFLETSATLSIFHCHSVTFMVFLPLSGSTSIFPELSATFMVFHYHSGSTSGFHCHPESFRVFRPLPVSSLSHQQHSASSIAIQ